MSQANTEQGRLVSPVWPHAVDVLQGDINRQDEHDDQRLPDVCPAKVGQNLDQMMENAIQNV